MKPMAIAPTQLDTQHIGMIITRDQPTHATTFRKGHRISADDVAVLATSAQPIHAVELEHGEIPESDAVPQIATAICGNHTAMQPMVQGRINIRSTVRGLLLIDTEALLHLNTNLEIGVFTHVNGIAVNADALVAGVKIAPVAISGEVLHSALAGITSPVIDVLPFRPLGVICIVTENLQGRVRDRFEQTLRQKMDWYGADLREIVWVDEDVSAIATALQRACAENDLVFTAGSHMMDPLDPILLALHQADADLVRLGAPAHPGSMVWVAWHAATETPIISLASCSMFSRSTVADLLMPHVFAGERITNKTFASLGHGGLLDRGMEWRFPPYEVDE